MPQVTTLAIDIAPSNDYSTAQSEVFSSSNSSGKKFAKVIEQHQQEQNNGKISEQSGNKSNIITDEQLDKSNADEKSSTIDVQSKDKESGTVADVDINVVDKGDENDNEKTLPVDKEANKKTLQIDNIIKQSEEQKISASAFNNGIEGHEKDSEDSTEQLMSWLSASQKILSGDVKAEDKNGQQVSENKKPSKAEIDALLKQVLAGNDQPITDKLMAGSETGKVSNNLTEQFKTNSEFSSENIVKKVRGESKPADEAAIGDEATRAKNTEKLSTKITNVEPERLMSIVEKQSGLAMSKSQNEISVNSEVGGGEVTI